MRNFESMRPTELYNKVIEQREKDGRAFYEKYGCDFVEVLCPACSHAATDVEFIKWKTNEKMGEGGYKHYICQQCKTLYTSPRPSEALLNVFYSEFDAPKMWTELLLQADYERKVLQYRPRVEKILDMINKNKGKIAVDVGAGSGAFASALKDGGQFEKVIALDISQECVNACRQQGIESYCASIEILEEASVDMIFMNDMAEHLFDPKEFLHRCYDALSEGGWLSIATPNGQGFDFQILKEATGNITPPEHLQYFNPQSITFLLKSVGFSDVKVETPGILDVEIVDQAKGMRGESVLQNNQYIDFILDQSDDIKQLFQKFLQDAKLSSHMLVLAQKC